MICIKKKKTINKKKQEINHSGKKIPTEKIKPEIRKKITRSHTEK